VVPQRSPEEQHLARHLYRLLAEGHPVCRERLTSQLALPVPATEAVWQRFGSRVRYNEAGQIVAFGGLSLQPTAHRFLVNGKTLYTWCAWDTLFLPAILKQSAQVASTCPATGTPIRLRVAPEGVTYCAPTSTVVSFVLPEARAYNEDVVANFCCYVSFFRSAEVGAAWVAQHAGAFLLSLDEAYALGQRRMAALFDAL
jgi:alkylmercury lyase